MEKEALFYEKLEKDRVRCRLCPNFCVIAPNGLGSCGIRKNKSGKLFTLIYGEVTSVALDPIEKKPLYHYHPGKLILSIGTKGCNFHCPYCQNWHISQDMNTPTETVTSEWLVKKAKEAHSFGIAYTYNEPFIWFEFVLDAAKLARENGLENVFVTNGYVNPEPLDRILPFIDAMNIDLKSIDEDFYKKYPKGKLPPVLETIKKSQERCHIELTNLLIPGLNDSRQQLTKLIDWVCENLGPEVPMHFSRYFPCHKFTESPPTPIATLHLAEEIARKKLRHVYLGNV